MEIVVVGSGTAVPHPDRAGSAFLVLTDEPPLLLDCGPGAAHGMARLRLPWREIGHLVLSHFHTDHVGDLPGLFFGLKHGAERPDRALELIGPPGTERLVRRLADAFGDYFLDPGFPFRTTELAAGGASLDLGGGRRLSACPTPHTDASFAYRLDTGSASVGYTGDTGPSAELAAFLAGVDLLITECSVPDEHAMPTHLTPRSAAELARTARPRRLLLTHMYPLLERRDVPALVREAGWDGDLALAYDGLRVAL